MKVKECAFDHRYKLYRSGEFFDLQEDLDEQNPLKKPHLSGQAAQAYAKLQKVLDQFTNARPEELDQQLSAKASSKPSTAKTKREKASR